MIFVFIIGGIASMPSFDKETFPNSTIYKRDTAPSTCWIQSNPRGVGRPVSSCPDGYERVGLLCYLKCPIGTKSFGPSCLNGSRVLGRGWAKTLQCPPDQEYHGGLCYPSCAPGFVGVGPVCWESCPSETPYSCGLLCTADHATCTKQEISIAFAGFSVLYGIGLLGASIAALTSKVGGAVIVIAAFGVATTATDLTTQGVNNVLTTLLSYPFCNDPDLKAKATQAQDIAFSQYERSLKKTCSMVAHVD